MAGLTRSEISGSETFLGRERELDLLLGGLYEARAGSGRLFLIGGTRFIESAAGVTPAARLAREMWRETSGNPLFLGDAVRLLASERRSDEVVASGSLRMSVPDARATIRWELWSGR